LTPDKKKLFLMLVALKKRVMVLTPWPAVEFLADHQ
jgi:hypothetical protein